jgi:hypothetical protein
MKKTEREEEREEKKPVRPPALNLLKPSSLNDKIATKLNYIR